MGTLQKHWQWIISWYYEIDLHLFLSLASLFCYFATGFLSPDCPDFPDSVKSLWIRNYVERKYELLGSQPSEIPEVVFDKAEIEFALAEIVSTQISNSGFSSQGGQWYFDLGILEGIHCMCYPFEIPLHEAHI